jgi:hypothetical protein
MDTDKLLFDLTNLVGDALMFLYQSQDLNIPRRLIQFALKIILDFDMDDSHGIKHFIQVARYVKEICQEFADQSIIPGMEKERETHVLIIAGFVHDLIDSKYVPDGGHMLIEELTQCGYAESEINDIMYIIQHMSFSKRVERRKQGLDMIQPGRLFLATAIVVDADQLDAYDPQRCVMYQDTKFIDEPNCIELRRNWCKTILVNRVLQYIPIYMNTETARKLAEPMHAEVLEYVNRELSDAEVYQYP